jgi:hypothetical protein
MCVCVCVEGVFKIKIRNVILQKTEGDTQRHLQLSELSLYPVLIQNTFRNCEALDTCTIVSASAWNL